MVGAAAGHGAEPDRRRLTVQRMDVDGLRERIPLVVAVLVRRGADFASAEDAVQAALLRALEVWPRDPPRDPTGWLITVAWRAFIDLVRSDTARAAREERMAAELRP
jgi:predicted RNA polymerase sigma factor